MLYKPTVNSLRLLYSSLRQLNHYSIFSTVCQCFFLISAFFTILFKYIYTLYAIITFCYAVIKNRSDLFVRPDRSILFYYGTISEDSAVFFVVVVAFSSDFSVDAVLSSDLAAVVVVVVVVSVASVAADSPHFVTV